MSENYPTMAYVRADCVRFDNRREFADKMRAASVAPEPLRDAHELLCRLLRDLNYHEAAAVFEDMIGVGK